MPALPARRALITGTRSYPVPQLAAHGRDALRARLQSDLGPPAGDHRDDARPRRGHGLRERQPGAPDARASPTLRTTTANLTPPATTAGVESDLLVQLDRLSAATAAHYRLGIQTLRELERSGKPFFLGVDPFLPEDAFEAPRDLRGAEQDREAGHRADGRPPDAAPLPGRRPRQAARPLPQARGDGGRVGRPPDRRAPRPRPGRRHRGGRDRRPGHVARGARLPRTGHAHLAPRLLRDPAAAAPPEAAGRRRQHRLVRVHPRRGAHPSLLHAHPGAREDARGGPHGALRRGGPVGPLRSPAARSRRWARRSWSATTAG